MAQLFKPRANTIARLSLIGLVVALAAAGTALYAFGRTTFYTKINVPIEQPVPFSHQHHVAGLGIDCRYCHTSVEQSSFAGVPPTETCMTCHSQVWKDAPVLQPMRDSWQTGAPIKWTRVHDLPDYVYFNHSIHVNKGIGCESCHGRVDRMPLTWKTQTLYMRWCLDCHRQPQNFLRPTNEVTDMNYRPPAHQFAFGQQLIAQNHVRTAGLTDCYTCHR